MFGEGISSTGELLNIAVEEGIIKKSGAWFAYNDEKIGQGAEKAKNYLKEHQDVFDEIDHKVRAAHGLLDDSEVAETEEETTASKTKAKAKKEEKVVETEEIELELED